MDFRLLGPLEVGDGHGGSLPLGGAKQRALLAILLLHAGQVVPTDRLIDELWSEDPPDTAANVLQVYIGQLRKALEPDRTRRDPTELIATRPRGYLLQIAPDALDLERCTRLVEKGREALVRDAAKAARLLREALALWRGQPLADVVFASVGGEVARLEELRFTALESRIEADLARGGHAALVGELEALATSYPLRERLRAHWMLALYRSGRQAEALAVYRETQRFLAEELGIDPSPELQSLELAVLRHDPLIAGPKVEVPTPTEAAPNLSASSTIPVPATPLEERKVLTVLVVELSTFSSDPTGRDPEDEGQHLAPYFARVRSELERRGGTVEQAMGNVVMALFGVPVSHEDDPERAVRAALAIREWVLENESLELRAAVNTGDALVTFGTASTGVQPVASGDVINTTVRLQAAALSNEILVGEASHRATSHLIAYEAAKPMIIKGKAEPRAVWAAIEPRSRQGGDLLSGSSAPLIGREAEVSALADALHRIRRDRVPQLLTLVGMPGIGKSRLVAELFRIADGTPGELISWRQGRSPSYGDEITFWALAEMVKAQAGILETDSPEQAQGKLRASIEALIPEPTDARWVESHLRPLAGLSSDIESGGDRREEGFTAWRRFFEALAEHAPLVLVFEDLHWADDNLLDFVEELVDWTTGVPMLVVCTARPELFERRAGWGGGTRKSATVWLAPLSEQETARLISYLSGSSGMPIETQQALLTRAGGNPLYAEQYMRMLAERVPSSELAVPETVQGIIAARLDTLPAEEKRLLQSAAVIGKAFWLSALTALEGADRRDAERTLHRLERKDFVQRARRSSVAGESEYAFQHILVRDVAYAQIPRRKRAEQHRLAADWIASLGRSEDHAEMLAHHYTSAIKLRRAIGELIDANLAERALESLGDSGDRAFSLNAYARAADHYEEALELAPDGSVARARLLFNAGRMRRLTGDLNPELLSSAAEELAALGDPEGAAEAEALLVVVHSDRGDKERSSEHLRRALELIEARPSSRAKATVACRAAGFMMVAGESAEAIRIGREVLAMADGLGLDNLRAVALNYIGSARSDIGDAGGIQDLEESLAIAVQASTPVEICGAQGNLSSVNWQWGHLSHANALLEETDAVALRFGLMRTVRSNRANRTEYHYGLGLWQEALDGANEFLAEVEGGSPHADAPTCYRVRAAVGFGRGDVQGAIADSLCAIELARDALDPSSLYRALAEAARILCEVGNYGDASVLADEVLTGLRSESGIGYGITCVHTLAWTLTALGRGKELLEALHPSDVLWVRAARSFASGDMRAAADVCKAMGAASEEARDRLLLANALVKQKQQDEAELELDQVLSFYQRVGASRYIREVQLLPSLGDGSVGWQSSG